MKARPPTTQTATTGRYVSPASGWPNASMMKAMASTPNTKIAISTRSNPRAGGEDGELGMANPGYNAVEAGIRVRGVGTEPIHAERARGLRCA